MILASVLLLGVFTQEALDLRILHPEQGPVDARLQPARTLRDPLHPWTPPSDLDAWTREARDLRRQIEVAAGLWPLPEAAPLRPVRHGRVEREEYTVEKVSFASVPGHFVTGSLYLPRPGVGALGADGRRAGVLSPHGHWAQGRFHDAGAATASRDLGSGAEDFEAASRHPLQARMVQLARMGCVVFHYDMIGYASSSALNHRDGFQDLDAVLRLHNALGVQTFNSIQALSFLGSLEEVDPERLGVTGASGGGTQTFVLCALDARPAAAFPAVMVSTGMQGGCVCENASYFRLGTNNAAIAALFAPRPMALSGADDWTIDIEWRGFPQMREVWSLYGQPDAVRARCFPQYGHNYNRHARAEMASWFRRHLGLDDRAAMEERDFVPLSRAEMEVFDAEHPMPEATLDAAGLRAQMRRRDAEVLERAVSEGPEAFRELVGGAARVMFCPVPGPEEGLRWQRRSLQRRGSVTLHRALVGRLGEQDAVPLVAAVPSGARRVVLWLSEEGKSGMIGEDGAWCPTVARWLSQRTAVVAIDVLGTGEATSSDFPFEVDSRFPGYTFGYNRPVIAERVRDIATAMRAALTLVDAERLDLVGTAQAGLWTILARALWASEQQAEGWPSSPVENGRTVVDLQGFGFGQIRSVNDPRLLPGSLRYGGVGGLAALAPVKSLVLFGVEGVPEVEWSALLRMARAAGQPLRLEPGPLDLSAAARVLR